MPVVGSASSGLNELTLRDFIEEALAILYRATERPYQLAVGANHLTDADDTTMTISGDTDMVQVTTVLECGQELMLVTAKSTASTPVFTVSRGYAGTPKTGHAAGDALLVNPTWTRYEVRRAVLRAFRGPMSTYLPCLTSVKKTPTTGQYFVEMPENTIEVFRVGYVQPNSAVASSATTRWAEFTQWELIEDVPDEVSSTGKLLTFPSHLVNTELHVTYQQPYTWSGMTNDPGEDETIDIPFGFEDVPALYAAAYLLFNREVSRAEVDRIEEWNNDAAIRQGVNIRLAQALWSEFYRRVDEARRLQNVPKKRPYRKMKTDTGRSWR